MNLIHFGKKFPEIYEKEKKSFILNSDDSDKMGVKEGLYRIFELYCTNKNCDCEELHIAIVGVEGIEEYNFTYDLEKNILNISEQQENPEDVENMLKVLEEVLEDEKYIEVLNRHYDMMKYEEGPLIDSSNYTKSNLEVLYVESEEFRGIENLLEESAKLFLDGEKTYKEEKSVYDIAHWMNYSAGEGNSDTDEEFRLANYISFDIGKILSSKLKIDKNIESVRNNNILGIFEVVEKCVEGKFVFMKNLLDNSILKVEGHFEGIDSNLFEIPVGVALVSRYVKLHDKWFLLQEYYALGEIHSRNMVNFLQSNSINLYFIEKYMFELNQEEKGESYIFPEFRREEKKIEQEKKILETKKKKVKRKKKLVKKQRRENKKRKKK